MREIKRNDPVHFDTEPRRQDPFGEVVHASKTKNDCVEATNLIMRFMSDFIDQRSI